jgi:hypothetical protein
MMRISCKAARRLHDDAVISTQPLNWSRKEEIPRVSLNQPLKKKTRHFFLLLCVCGLNGRMACGFSAKGVARSGRE